jgi:hypothetical protein
MFAASSSYRSDISITAHLSTDAASRLSVITLWRK